MSGYLLDTSVVIGDVPHGRGPALSAAISVVTVGELIAGVELARTAEVRRSREARLAAVRAAFAPIPVDNAVAEHYGRLLAFARRRQRTTKASDLLIAATASARERTLITRDERQGELARAAGISIRLVA